MTLKFSKAFFIFINVQNLVICCCCLHLYKAFYGAQLFIIITVDMFLIKKNFSQL